MTTLTVTATQGGGSFQGLLLRVKVITGAKAAASQTGGHGTSTASAPNEATLTTTAAGSVVYGAVSQGASITAAANCTFFDNYADTTNTEWYGSFRVTAATGTPGSVTAGSATGDNFADCAIAEILQAAGQTLAEDSSGPVMVAINTATTVTTASFSPPAGSLLVALVGSDGAANGTTATTMAITDSSSLTWTPLAQAASAATCYAGVFIADVPSGSGPSAGTDTAHGTDSGPGGTPVISGFPATARQWIYA